MSKLKTRKADAAMVRKMVIYEDDDLIAPAIQDAIGFLRKNESKGEGDA